ncbi:MAG TPA: hypothetical protein VGP47_06655 [Parachlamydiaceae bacterium]|nr:hypothetical protein [Parachlamydiaceae bacterium]
MSIDTAQLYSTAYTAISQFANSTANSVEYYRDSALKTFEKNLPETTCRLSEIAKTINNSEFAKALENQGTTPAIASACVLGFVSGNLLLDRPAVAIASLSAAIMLTSNKTHLTMLAGSVVIGATASGFMSFVRRAVCI